MVSQSLSFETLFHLLIKIFSSSILRHSLDNEGTCLWYGLIAVQLLSHDWIGLQVYTDLLTEAASMPLSQLFLSHLHLTVWTVLLSAMWRTLIRELFHIKTNFCFTRNYFFIWVTAVLHDVWLHQGCNSIAAERKTSASCLFEMEKGGSLPF